MTVGSDIVALDPFGFLVGQASAIRPLGGTQPCADPRYAFHTAYIPYNGGRLHFVVKLEGIRATSGELHINVYGFVPGSGRDAVIAMSSRIQLAETSDAAFERELTVQSVAGVSYAVHGYIPDAENVSGRAVEISVRESHAAGIESLEVEEPTSFGTERLDRPSELVSKRPPSFARPLSQCLTPGQLADDSYHAWKKRLGGAGDDAAIWPTALMAQALELYGMARTGARGLGLGDAAGKLPQLLADQGCGFTLCDIANGQIGWGAGEGAATAPWVAGEDLPAELRGFDFLWSLDLLPSLDNEAQATNFLNKALKALRPGGYALFGMAMVDRRGEGAPPAGALDRKQIERIALAMISRSHDVAQLNFGSGDADEALRAGVPLPFVLIVRRGTNL